mgnify:CR=1 FL=1
MITGLRDFNQWLDDVPPDKYLFDIVVKASLRSVFYILKGRNAWNSTWIRRYYPDRCALSFEGAANCVERMRVQGSTWSILEIPMILFTGRKLAMAVGDINDPAVFATTRYSAYCPPNISDIQFSIRPTQNSTLMCLIMDPTTQLPPARDFRQFKSVSLGGNEQLEWHAQDARTFDLRPMKRIINTHRRSLRKLG